MREPATGPDMSVIVPVGGRTADPIELFAEYRSGLDDLNRPYEMIFVLDGPSPAFAAGLRQLRREGQRLTVVALNRPFGEATALMAGFEHASGRIIVTLPAYQQIDATEVRKLVSALDSSDAVIGRRWPRAGGALEHLRRWLFHRMVAWVTGVQFRDLGCGARAFDRRVLDETPLFGEQHRFLAILAERQGFRVREIDLRQSPVDRLARVYRPREYLRSFLDIVTIVFLARFTKRPLRFFGMIGAVTFLAGAALVLWFVAERLFFGEALSDRPALLLSSLLMVLGLQLFALGLLGELMIFTHGRSTKEYRVERVVESGTDEQRPDDAPAVKDPWPSAPRAGCAP